MTQALPLTRRALIGTVGAVAATQAVRAATAVTTELVLTHPDGRATTYQLRTPMHGRRWPVVLFSHGANSSSAAYDRLWDAWVARGFAAIGPNHIDSGPPAAQGKPPASGLWATRIADTTLPLRERAPFDKAAGNRLDWSRVAAAGHSFGAVVAQALAGARITNPLNHDPSGAEPTIRACLAFSPPGPLKGFVPADAWTPVRVPTLLQTGDADQLPGFVDDWHSRLIGFASAPNRWTAVGHGVDHYFGGLICRLDPAGGSQGPALDEIASLSATFLEAYLGGRPGALRTLEARARRGDDGVVTVSGGRETGAGGPALAGIALASLPLATGLSMRRRHLLKTAFAATLMPAAAFAAPAAAPAPAPIFPPSDTVPIHGAARPFPFRQARGAHLIDAKALDAAQAFSDGLGGTALLVAIDGALVHERYADGFDQATLLKTYSMAKSVMGIAYGLAVADGVVSLDDRLGQHVEELRDDPRGALTLRQLLQMRSGLRLDSLFRRDPKAIELVVGRRVTQTALETPLVHAPDEHFEYNNVNSFLAGLALDRALVRAGRGRYSAFMSRALWQPLGQSDATLEVESAPDGSPRFFAGLDASGRDWLRIGTLFVQNGRIHGRQVVPAAWLHAMTTPSPNPSYGLQMWIGQPWTPERRYGPDTAAMVPCKEPYRAKDLVFFDGSGGQRVYMVPSRRLVIVRTGAASPSWEDSTLPNTIIRGLT